MIFGIMKVWHQPAESLKYIEADQCVAEEPPKPPKHQPKALSQLNQGKTKKDALVSDFMYRQQQRANARMTDAQVQRHITRVFDSLDRQRGFW